ncbi:fibrinogen- and Ig-binding protein [Trachinotus anak]|uniref:fibrinogen- and Ig-binding protein n=1 Tax=Trachinotus anak TaxID=443729 RepID=UPI0039F1F43C
MSDSSRKNYIPSGRQLHRTPLAEVKRHLDFCNGNFNDSHEEPQENMEICTTDQDNDDLSRMFDVSTPEKRTENILEPDHLNSMLKGMKGYQLTAGDLEFIKKMKQEEVLKKLQGELEEVQRSLKREMMDYEQACASRKMAQAELNKLPSCEDLTEWAQVVLKMTLASAELTDLDAKSLLAMVTKEKVQRAMDEKRAELNRIEKTLANKRKKTAKERGQLEKQIATEQLKIQGLMSQLSDLRAELAQEEEACEALERQSKIKEVKHQGKGRKKKPPEKLQDATNHPVAPVVAGEETQNIGLRRSKRIASRR